MASTRIDVAALDFDLIKANFRDFLKSQQQFKDYNFEGSSIDVLLDILAFNTHYLGWYQNMIGNEMFLDTAQLRSSVVSHAKHLAYTPRSIRAARAVIKVVINAPPGNTSAAAVIERFTKFSARIDSDVFEFVTTQTYTAYRSNDQFIFPEVELIQGISYQYRHVVDKHVPKQRFVLPDNRIDVGTLVVRVQRNIADNRTEVYTLADDITEVKKDSRAYFLQEVEEGKYEVYFGDGIVGRAVEDGNIIILDYIVTSADAANGAIGFFPVTQVANIGAQFVTVTTIAQAHSGAPAETIDQIKFAAPKNYEAQNRAVTIQDYKTLIAKDYPVLDSVAVWGGEDSIPPQYGKVFLSLKPVEGYVVTEEAKQFIINEVIRRRNIVSVIPEIMDPDYTYLLVNCRVRYHPAETDKNQGQITSITYEAIRSYNKVELGKFDRMLKYSRLLNAIDIADTSISNNLTTLKMRKRFRPRLRATTNYTFNLHNPIRKFSFYSSQFVVAQDPLVVYNTGDIHYLEDDGSGTIWIVRIVKGQPNTRMKKAGTIDYVTGAITIRELNPFILVEDGALDIDIFMSPEENDIVPTRNNILTILDSDITVNAIPLVESSTT